jgi:serine/threonine protein kinase
LAFEGQDKLAAEIRLSFTIHKDPLVTRIDFYDFRNLIGQGGIGKVYLGIHKLTKLRVAIKVIELKNDALIKVEKEVAIFRRLYHKNIVTLFEAFEDKACYYIVMEFCGGGDLSNFVHDKGRLCEFEAREIFKQLVAGVASLHSEMVLHRDLKLGNILIDTALQTVKICDFSHSCLVEHGVVMTSQCGTPPYVAPEVVYEEGYTGFASDVWSLGVVLYAMCVGKKPFKGKTKEELRAVLRSSAFFLPDYLSDEVKDLLAKMLMIDPHRRISVSEISTHNWFSASLTVKWPAVTFCASRTEPASEEAYNSKTWDKNAVQDFLVEKVCCLGFPKEFVVQSVNSGVMNHAAATYLLLQSKII